MVAVKLGDTEEWDSFQKRNQTFIVKLQYVIEIMNRVFIRDVNAPNPADKVIFLLGRWCVEDFMEILLLCGNGYGIGGSKLLRGMYERYVTIGYIQKFPEKADDFLYFHYINAGKWLNHTRAIFPYEKLLSQENIDKIDKPYNDAKKQFKNQRNWSAMNILDMSKKIGFDKLYLKCYLEPTMYEHATSTGLIGRLKDKNNGKISFNENAQHKISDEVIMSAHNIILNIIKIENDQFNMGLESDIQALFSDFIQIWENKEESHSL